MIFFCVSVPDDTALLIRSARKAASAADATIRDAKERLRNISENVGIMTSTNISVEIDDILTDADQAGKYLMVENTHFTYI